MIGLILAGGISNDFIPLTNYLPNVMIPLRGRPIIDYNVRMLKEFGIKKIYILAGKFSSVIKDYYEGDKCVSVVKEHNPLGTAGAITPFLDGEELIVLNGDSIYNIDLKQMYARFKNSYCDICIGVKFVHNCKSYGLVKITDGWVTSFSEKPGVNKKAYVSVGLYMFKKNFEILTDDFCMLETDVFPKHAQDRNIVAFTGCNRWWNIGTPEEYEIAKREVVV